MATLPTEYGIEDLILDALVALATKKLQTEISVDDASRATTVAAGPWQDEPTAVMVIFHENHPDTPSTWPHFPVRYRQQGESGMFSGLSDNVRVPIGYERIGGGSQEAYAFTAVVSIQGDELDLDLDYEGVRHIASVVGKRLWRALQSAGPKIGTGSLVQDDFGISVNRGPQLGPFQCDREAGTEDLLASRQISFYYICDCNWSTDDW